MLFFGVFFSYIQGIDCPKYTFFEHFQVSYHCVYYVYIYIRHGGKDGVRSTECGVRSLSSVKCVSRLGRDF